MTASAKNQPTLMRREIEEIPAAMARLLDSAVPSIDRCAQAARELDPHLIVTIARGSSDHCAAYLKYAFEIYAGIPVASLGPSVASIYGAELRLAKSVAIAISQSGKSPDIVEAVRMCRTAGALPVAITNDTASPLSEKCDFTFDVSAGPERSVAATKTFVNSLLAGLLFLAMWKEDDALLAALHRLPKLCAAAVNSRWDDFLTYMTNKESLYVLGRGPSLSLANEMALKFKETCQIHAEAYSAAEVMHGPVSIVGDGFPVMALVGHDASRTSMLQAIRAMSDKGARVFSTDQLSPEERDSEPETGHPLTEPVLSIVRFYAFVEELARLRGRNPDLPPNLRKVTETV